MKSPIVKAFVVVFVGLALFSSAQTANAAQLTSSQIQAIISLLQSFNASPAAIQSVAAALNGNQGYPGYPTYPTYPNPSYPVPTTPGYPGYPTYPYPGQYGDETFRLDREFTLYPGQSAREDRGELTVTFDQIEGYGSGYWYSSNDDDAVRVTLGVSCPQGVYCASIWYPQQSFVIEEDESISYMDYEVTVTDIGSNRATFRVEDDDRNHNDDDDEDGSISIEEPDRGDEVEQGDTLRVEWTVEDRPSNSSVALELFTEGGRSVGTIAIVEGRSGSYSWRVPTPSVYCTMQYPNGLCGMDLRGDYYIRARLLAGNGFDNSYEYDRDDSGVFTIER